MEIADSEIGFFEVFEESSKLPNEMLMEILSYCELPTLLNCRLVCKNLSEMSSQICRKRSVQLNTLKWNTNPAEVWSIFRDLISLPWSSCTFINLLSYGFDHAEFSPSRHTDWYEKLPEYLSFFRFFGHCITKFSAIGSTLSDIADFLPHLSNLQILMIYAGSPPEDPIFNKRSHKSIISDLKCIIPKQDYWDHPPVIAVNLRLLEHYYLPKIPYLYNLRKLYVDPVGIFSPQLFQKFILKQAKLEKIHLNYGSGITTQISLPVNTRVPIDDRSYTELRYSETEKTFLLCVLFNIGVCLKKLNININVVAAYEILEALLDENSQTLEKLSLTCLQLHSTSRRLRRNFRIPNLYVLNSLKVQTDQNHPPLGFQNLTKFETDQFPALTKVEFVNFDQQFEAFRNSVHDRVQELVLNNCGKSATNFGDMDWASVFPNLKKLKTNADAPNLQYIFSRMQQLEYLDLIVELPKSDWLGRVTDASNPNFIFSGIPNPSRAINFFGEGLEVLIEARTNPSLVDLKGLKSLKLKFSPRNSVVFDDSGAILSIVPLQRLTSLGLYNIQISSNCLASLQARYENVDVQQLHRPEYDPGPKRGWLYRLLFGRN